MGSIVFFSIPAHGHTNPTIPVVQELTRRGHTVWYYSFEEFRQKLEGAGARFLPCDAYLPPAPPNLDNKVGRDFAALIEMIADATIAMDQPVCAALTELRPDCVVADSLCFWGKLFAKKLALPYVCSTTTFAFNQVTAKLMKPKLGEAVRMFTGMPRIQKKIRLLQSLGYPLDSFVQIVQNDNDTPTVVYTSRELQPRSETFSDRFVFVGPSLPPLPPAQPVPKLRPLVYISLGTVNNRNVRFYKTCLRALGGLDLDVVLSVGDRVSLDSLGPVPVNFQVSAHVPQLEVLQRADVFVTHCGMNSVHESIWSGAPMVLVPQQSEQALVAARAEEAGAGLRLRGASPAKLRQAVRQILDTPSFRERAQELGRAFRAAGGAPKAADAIISAAGL